MAGLGLASGVASGILGRNQAEDQAQAQRRSAERQQLSTYASQLEDWEYNEAISNLNFDFAVNSARLSHKIDQSIALQNWNTANRLEQARYLAADTNAEIQFKSENAVQARDYQITQLLQAADYSQQLRVYQASERTFSENTRLISQAASNAYSFEKDRLRFERAGINIQAEEGRARFNAEADQARIQAKQVEARYRGELRQAGFSGEALQMEVEKRMQQFTAKQDVARREALSESSQVAASGRSGATATRMMADPFNRSDLMLGSMGVELAFFGSEQQVELFKLADATGLAGQMADMDRARIYNSLDTSARMTNLNLESLNTQERQAIWQSNNQLDDIGLQARSQMNEARSNRELRPMVPLKLPEPLPVARTVIPQPFLQPMPIQATPGLQPLIPSRPMSAPRPRLGSSIPKLPSGGGSILASGILQGIQSAVGNYTAFKPPG
jgi:hypothetical protein